MALPEICNPNWREEVDFSIATILQYEGTFDDYLEMFIQFGYVILFSAAYPLAGLCALLNNIIEIRGDAFKLCLVHKRPFGQRVGSIGTWQVLCVSFSILPPFGNE